jgi:hypothetical protein
VNSFRNNVLGLNAEDTIKEIDIKAYAKYILKQGGIEERRELMRSLKSNLTLINKIITIEN